MVGIIIASHGDLANGIKQSGEMIFGQQANVTAVSLRPEEGPEQFKQNVLEAIEAFDTDQVLFLVDLWGGTPFNQCSAIVQDNDKMAIVTGLNLPMLIEAYGLRMSEELAVNIAQALSQTAKDGVKLFPTSLETLASKQEATTEANSEIKKQVVDGRIPEGTVLGDGKIKYVLARVDTRLLHGQVATSWTKSTNPDRIIVVSDAVSKDGLRKSMIENAAPPGVKAHVIPIDKLVQIDKDPRFGLTKAIILFETPQDALSALEKGVDIKELNLGSMAHSKGKVAVNPALAFDMNDVNTIEKIKATGVKIDIRKVPADHSENLEQLLTKARNMLNK